MANHTSQFHQLQQQAVDTKTPAKRLQELANQDTELARLVATNPTAPPPLLQELANSKDTITRQNITANPNTPSQVLLKLASEFPGELLNNPIFDLLLLENPNLIHDMDSVTLKKLLTHESVPIFFLEIAAKIQNNPEACCYVARHPKTPAKLLEQLAQHSSWNVRIAVGENPHIPLKLLEQLAQDTGAPVIVNVAKSPHLSATTLEKLAHDRYYGVRISVAENPSTPLEVLEHLAKDSLASVRNRALSNIKSRKHNQQ